MTEHGPVPKAHYPGIHIAWRAFYDAHRNSPHYPADDFKAGYRAGMDAARDERAALEAALASSEYRLTTASILLGNLVSSGDEPDDADEAAEWQRDCAVARAFIDAGVATRAGADAGEGRE